jgi:hypothetical protein
MPKPKLMVSMREAADLVRSGATDIELMAKYGISAEGLEKLLNKLVAAGQLSEKELDFRSQLSQLSDYVDLRELRPRNVKKQIINAAEAIQDLRAGASDLDLMKKYNISGKGLESLFSKLVEAGEISQYELERRKNSSGVSDPLVGNDSNSRDQGFGWLDEEGRDPGRLGFFSKHRIALAAGIGAAGGVCALLLFFIVAFGIEGAKTAIDAARSGGQTKQDTNRQELENFVKVLEAITRSPNSTTGSSEDTGANALKSCLKACEDEFQASEDGDKALLVNCRRECLGSHSQRFRKMRETYHN